MTRFDDGMKLGIAVMIKYDGKKAVLTRKDGNTVDIIGLDSDISKNWVTDSSGRYEIWEMNFTIPTDTNIGGVADPQIDETITYLEKTWRIDSIIAACSSETVVKLIYDQCKAKEYEKRMKRVFK